MIKMGKEARSLREVALDFLARREHSCFELQQKLLARGYARDAVAVLLEHLKEEHLQSDQRFAEAYIYMRVQKGYGRIKIAQELKARGVADELISETLSRDPDFWHQQLVRVYQKKFCGAWPKDARIYAQQVRFLVGRGFSLAQINEVIRDAKVYDDCGD